MIRLISSETVLSLCLCKVLTGRFNQTIANGEEFDFFGEKQDKSSLSLML